MLQFRIVLSLIILIPFATEIRKDWDKIQPPGIVPVLCLCLVPIIMLIFLVNRKTLLWTTFLILFTGIGGFVGLVLGFATGDPGETERLLLIAFIPAGLFWWFAVRIKHRYTRNVESNENGG